MKNSNYISLIVLLLQVISLDAQQFTRSVGQKQFETSNHLGNVAAISSDRKQGLIQNSTGKLITQDPNIIAYSDYYPYGMLMEGRNDSEAYRYGFQGQEQDDEVKGAGNAVNYSYRMHDPRVGRFFAVDPLYPKYPYYSSYQFSGNKVIHKVELEGLEEGEPKTYGNNGNEVELNTRSSNFLQNTVNWVKNLFRSHPQSTIQKQFKISQQRYEVGIRPQQNVNFPQTGRNQQINQNFVQGTTINLNAQNIPDQFIITDPNNQVVYNRILGVDASINLNQSRDAVNITLSGNYTIQVFGDPNNTNPNSNTAFNVNTLSPPNQLTVLELVNEGTGEILYGVGSAAATAYFEKEHALVKNWDDIKKTPIPGTNSFIPKYHEYKQDIIFMSAGDFDNYLQGINTNFGINNYQNTKIEK